MGLMDFLRRKKKPKAGKNDVKHQSGGDAFDLGSNPQDETLEQDSNEKKARNAYILARMEWNDRYLNMSKNLHAWKVMCFLSTLIAIILALGVSYIGAQSKIKPYLAVVDKVNFDVRVATSAEDIKMTDRIMKGLVQKEVRDLITKMRTVTADRSAQKRIMTDVYSRVARNTEAARLLTGFYKTRDPFDLGQKSLIMPEIRTALPVGDKTWQIEWIENQTTLAGELVSQKRYKANVTYKIITPETEKELFANPIGWYATAIDWQEQANLGEDNELTRQRPVVPAIK